jgi:uncharacterized membrane-anchored protein YjiN (DUF445 family)
MTAELAQAARLRRMRRIATGLLLAMAVLFVAAHMAARKMGPDHAWLAYVIAFAEAAMVGALADWFAVTALFRRPLGLPIPHTAIIPSNKDRIGENIAHFLEHNFMTQEVLRGELEQVDFAGAAAHWLEQDSNSRAAAVQIVGAIPALMRLAEDKDAGSLVQRVLSASLKEVRLAPLLAQVLQVLVHGRQHFRLLEHILTVVARALDENRGYIRQKVHDNSPRWIPKSIDEKFFERLMEGVHGVLAEIQGEDSEWRERFQAATDELIAHLATSPEYEARLRTLLSDSLGHPLFREYALRVWQDGRQRLLDDAASPDSQLVARLQQALRAFGKALAQDEATRLKLNNWLRIFAADAIVERRGLIAAVVQRVIRTWDGDTVSRKFELHVGSDLQFIRINGTLVGGLVGLGLHALALLL